MAAATATTQLVAVTVLRGSQVHGVAVLEAKRGELGLGIFAH